MKFTEKTLKVDSHNHLNIAVDVSSLKLDIYFEIPIEKSRLKTYRSKVTNKTSEISKAVTDYHLIALSHGFENIRIICEPTGSYSNNLLTVAKSLNFSTAYVNPEAVHKSKVIETNSSGKTDLIDAVIIYNLANRNKTIKHRTFNTDYEALRQLNVHYEDIDKYYVRARGYIHSWLKRLFPDLSIKSDTIYSKTGNALFKRYGFNPWKIIKKGFSHFILTMKSQCKGMQSRILQKIWQDAENTCEYSDPSKASIYEMILKDHYTDYLRYNKKKESIRTKMESLLTKLRKKDRKIPPACKGFISSFHVARLLGETGPLNDFKSYKALQSYLGMNLQEKQSGNYKGKTRISKKGRSLGRKILSQIVLPLVRKDQLYGELYHKQKEETGKPGPLLMTNYMRRFLKSFYGIYQSGNDFDLKRLFIDEGGYNKLEKRN